MVWCPEASVLLCWGHSCRKCSHTRKQTTASPARQKENSWEDSVGQQGGTNLCYYQTKFHLTCSFWPSQTIRPCHKHLLSTCITRPPLTFDSCPQRTHWNTDVCQCGHLSILLSGTILVPLLFSFFLTWTFRTRSVYLMTVVICLTCSLLNPNSDLTSHLRTTGSQSVFHSMLVVRPL